MKKRIASESKNDLIVIVGIQNGDEGKGRITQLFVPSADIICRPNAGSNAQHKVHYFNHVIDFRHVPVGVLNPECINILGSGMVINPIELAGELLMLRNLNLSIDKVVVSSQAHCVFPVFRLLNRVYELQRSNNKHLKSGNYKIGSAAQGYGVAMEFKAAKKGFQLLDFMDLNNEEIGELIFRIEHQILSTSKNYIAFYKEQMSWLYDEEVVHKRSNELSFDITRTFCEEMIRILSMTLYAKMPKALECAYEISEHILNIKEGWKPENRNLVYWGKYRDEISILVEYILGMKINEDSLFFCAKTNFKILSLAISILQNKISDKTPNMLRDALLAGKQIVFEGAQGTSLDVTHGLYPNTASGSATVPGMLADSGIGMPRVYSIGVCKPYLTTTGTASTVLPSILSENEITSEKSIRSIGSERDRKICWLDIPMLKNNIEINGISTLAITHLDALTGLKQIKVCTSYENETGEKIPFVSSRKYLKKVKAQFDVFDGWDENISEITDFNELPSNAKKYLQFVSNISNTPISFITVGPNEYQTIKCDISPNI